MVNQNCLEPGKLLRDECQKEPDVENCGERVSPRHFQKRLGQCTAPLTPQKRRPGFLTLESQVCGLGNVSEEFLKERKLWKKSRES